LPHDRPAPAPVQGPEGSLVTRHKRNFGEVSRLPSGRYRARYRELNGHRVSAPTTFPSKAEADRWLTLRRAELLKADWTATVTGTGTFGDYAHTWLAERQLKPRTRAHYCSLLDKQILPTFARTPLRSISPTMVRRWYTSLSPDTPTLRAHAYGLLRAILHTAVYDGEITANPAHIRGAGTTTRAVAITPATLDELTLLVAAMPPRRQAMILLAAWCGLRFGEITELRRRDINLQRGVVHVHRAVTRVNGEFVVTTPKSAAGRRDVAVPPHLLPLLENHLEEHTVAGPDALLFPAAHDPSRHLAPASLYKTFYRARAIAGRPDLRWHDLRHTGAVLAAHTGATLAELMNRLGHSTPQAALRYQHAINDRAQIATALSRLAEGAARTENDR
jgi:integrase